MSKPSPLSGKLFITPFACERPRFSRLRTHNSEAYTWNKQVLQVLLRKSLGRGFAPLKDPLGIALVFHVKRSAKPAKHLKHYPAKTPDLDNYVKAFFDAANKILFEDDAQICQLSARKMYCEEKPHIEFMVWKLFDRDDKHKELDRPE